LIAVGRARNGIRTLRRGAGHEVAPGEGDRRSEERRAPHRPDHCVGERKSRAETACRDAGRHGFGAAWPRCLDLLRVDDLVQERDGRDFVVHGPLGAAQHDDDIAAHLLGVPERHVAEDGIREDQAAANFLAVLVVGCVVLFDRDLRRGRGKPERGRDGRPRYLRGLLGFLSGDSTVGERTAAFKI
jgi:hypothetical protein